jgi:hypothetical protein
VELRHKPRAFRPGYLTVHSIYPPLRGESREIPQCLKSPWSKRGCAMISSKISR